MKLKIVACLTIAWLLCTSAKCQDSDFPVPDGWVVKKSSSALIQPAPSVVFLSDEPAIDGRLDPSLAHIPAQNFSLLAGELETAT